MTAKATLAATVAACLIVGGVGGYSLSKIVSSKNIQNRPAGFNGQRQNGGQLGGGRIMGQVQSITDGHITVKTQNNNSQIVITTSSTTYQKAASGSVEDVSVGSQIQITGTKNSDGSTTATSIQIVPEGNTPPIGGNPNNGEAINPPSTTPSTTK